MGNLGSAIGKVVSGIIVGLMVLAFAVWGMEDVFSAGGRDAVATLGDEPISSAEFEDAFRREVQRANAQRDQGLTNEEAVRMGLDRQVLNQLITSRALDIDAEDLGIGVDDRLAQDLVRDLPGLQNPITGEIDFDALQGRLRALNMSREQFEQEIVDGLRREQTVPAIVEGIRVPPGFAQTRFRFLSEQRQADVLTLTAAQAGDIADPTEAELADWVERNARLYTAPEFRQFQLIRIEPSDFAPDVDVTEEDVIAQYEYRRDLPANSQLAITSPETRTVVQIRTSDKAEARRLVERLDAGESPQTVADSVGGELRRFSNSLQSQILDGEVAELAFGLESGAADAVLGSLPFWYAVKVEAVTPAVEPTLDEMRDELRAELVNATALESVFDLSDQVQDMMDENRTFDEISDSLGVTVSEYDFVDRTGTTEDGLRLGGFTRLPGIAGEDSILREAFTNDIGFETDLFETSTEGYAAVRVTDIRESALRPLVTIREQAVADFRRDAAREALRDLAREVQTRLRAGEELDAVAAELGLTPERQIVVRTARNPALGDEVVIALQDAGAGDVVRGAAPDAPSQQVAVLRRILGTGDVLAGEFARSLREASREEIAADIQSAYRQAILSENPVQSNETLIRSTLGLDAGGPGVGG